MLHVLLVVAADFSYRNQTIGFLHFLYRSLKTHTVMATPLSDVNTAETPPLLIKGLVV